MVRRSRLACALVAAPLWLTTACLDAPIETRPGGPGNGNGNGNTEECTLNDSSLQPALFESSVMPGLERECSACHNESLAQGGYAFFGGAYLSAEGDENCDFVASIEAFVDFADRETPRESPMLRAIDGRSPSHPHTLEADESPRPEIEAYLDAIEGGGGGDVLAAFEADIQPIFDDAGGSSCSTGGGACHDTGAGAFTLHDRPAPGSAEMRENFEESVAKADNTATPESSTLYVKATTPHFGSPAISSAQAQRLADWIATLADE